MKIPASIATLTCVAVLASGTASAQELFAGSPDTTVQLGGGLSEDQDVAVDNQLGIVLLEDLGPLPTAAEVTAYALDANGDRLFGLETTSSLPGGIVVTPRDVVRWDGAAYSIELDGTTEGIPRGAAIDAIATSPGDAILVSFDTTVAVDGQTFADEDLARFDGALFVSAFDGSAAGMAARFDVDAAQDLGGGAFLVSLDTSGSLGGVDFDDEDVLRYDGAAWSLEIDASTLDADWRRADLDAMQVPEPGLVGTLLAGALAFFTFARRRRRMPTRPEPALPDRRA